MLRLLDRNGESRNERLGPPREYQRQGAGHAGEHAPLGHDETSQAPGRGAERSANSHLPLAFDTAREQEVGDVEARQQQDQPDDAHGYRRSRGQGAQLAVAFAQHSEMHATRLVSLGPLPGHLRGGGAQPALHLREAGAFLHFAQEEQPSRVTLLQRGGRREELEVVDRHPHVRRVQTGRTGK